MQDRVTNTARRHVIVICIALLLAIIPWLCSPSTPPSQDLFVPASDSVTVTEIPEPEPRQVQLVNVMGTSYRELEVIATAYSPDDPGVDGITYSGLPAAPGVVAVDPDVIPLGSVVYVPDYGYGVAADIGGAIRGRRIDVYFSSRSEALRWGRRQLTIKLYGGEVSTDARQDD